MDNKDLLKDSNSALNKGFLTESDPEEDNKAKSMEHLVEFFKAQVDNLEKDLLEKWESAPKASDCLKVRLLMALFGKGEEVSSWILDDLNLFKIMEPESANQIQSVIEDLQNIKQMSSSLSLQSLKVFLSILQ